MKNMEYKYMLLNRMEQDCKYFLGYGNRNEKYLWGKDVETHISIMKELWSELPLDKKPEWLIYEDICEYEREMKGEN